MEFEAGTSEPQPFVLSVRVGRHFLLPLAVEGWCADHCGADWRIDGDAKLLTVSFEEPGDQTLFMLSSYNQFVQ